MCAHNFRTKVLNSRITDNSFDSGRLITTIHLEENREQHIIPTHSMRCVKYNHTKEGIWIFFPRLQNIHFCGLVLTFYSGTFGNIFWPVGVDSFKNFNSEIKRFFKNFTISNHTNGAAEVVSKLSLSKLTIGDVLFTLLSFLTTHKDKLEV